MMLNNKKNKNNNFIIIIAILILLVFTLHSELALCEEVEIIRFGTNPDTLRTEVYNTSLNFPRDYLEENNSLQTASSFQRLLTTHDMLFEGITRIIPPDVYISAGSFLILKDFHNFGVEDFTVISANAMEYRYIEMAINTQDVYASYLKMYKSFVKGNLYYVTEFEKSSIGKFIRYSKPLVDSINANIIHFDNNFHTTDSGILENYNQLSNVNKQIVINIRNLSRYLRESSSVFNYSFATPTKLSVGQPALILKIIPQNITDITDF